MEICSFCMVEGEGLYLLGFCPKQISNSFLPTVPDSGPQPLEAHIFLLRYEIEEWITPLNFGFSPLFPLKKYFICHQIFLGGLNFPLFHLDRITWSIKCLPVISNKSLPLLLKGLSHCRWLKMLPFMVRLALMPKLFKRFENTFEVSAPQTLSKQVNGGSNITNLMKMKALSINSLAP